MPRKRFADERIAFALGRDAGRRRCREGHGLHVGSALRRAPVPDPDPREPRRATGALDRRRTTRRTCQVGDWPALLKVASSPSPALELSGDAGKPRTTRSPDEIVAKPMRLDALSSRRRSGRSRRCRSPTAAGPGRPAGLKGGSGQAADATREEERAASQVGVRSDAGEADPARGRFGNRRSASADLRSRARRRRCVDPVMETFGLS